MESVIDISVSPKKSVSPVKRREGAKLKQKGFEPPPECPVFRPTEEEFREPLKYINKIRPVGAAHGICKIIPPDHWKPPFVIDRDTFKFTPRIQRINELEATTRLRLNFIQKLAKYWAINGAPLEIPSIEKTPLDLWVLHHKVEEFGGWDVVNKEKLWTDVASDLGLVSKGVGSVVKNHYGRIVRPYLQWREAEEAAAQAEGKPDSLNASKPKFSLRELRSLEFLGPGPKMAVCSEDAFVATESMKTRKKKVLYDFDPMAKYNCKSCCSENDEFLVLCSTCDDRYHTYCLLPPLVEVPTTKWKCPKCLAANDSSKPLDEDFGFVHSEKEYTLRQFGVMADKFKTTYFKGPIGSIPTSQVEQEIWKVMGSLEETLTVEYGADLHTGDVGSGFPTKDTLKLASQVGGEEAQQFLKYAESPWNLNNLPVLKESALRHLTANISGMKVPWVYVGMCFSTFCWHNEDHWSYSINYLHWGEPKTWYGVPGGRAEDFELAIKCAAPELFQHHPDLLHHLVTTINPNIIMSAGVPIFRTDQRAGEFVVTFPRAYHAGFNQGYNFAEACNFAPPDWFPIGRNCMSHYSTVRRFCVFAQDELVCKMAESHGDLDEPSALAAYKDMVEVIANEKLRREKLRDAGIARAELCKLDEVADEWRQCKICKTTCYLSALVCLCRPREFYCLDHIDQSCPCPLACKTLKYSYTMSDLGLLMQKLRKAAEKFDVWLKRVVEVLECGKEKSKKVHLRVLMELLAEAKEKEFPPSPLIDTLEFYVHKAVKCSGIARRVASNVLQRVSDGNKQISVQDLTRLVQEIDQLPCIITEAQSIQGVLKKVLAFKDSANKLLSSDKVSLRRLEPCIKLGNLFGMDIHELTLLKAKKSEIEWLATLEELSEPGLEDIELATLRQLVFKAPDTLNSESSEKLKDLQKLLFHAESWHKKVDVSFIAPYVTLPVLESLLVDGSKLKVKLPLMTTLEQNIQLVKTWIGKANQIIEGKLILSVDELNSFISKGLSYPVQLAEVAELSRLSKDLVTWCKSLSQIFMRARSKESLLEVMWPRLVKSRLRLDSQLTDSSLLGPDQKITLGEYFKAVHQEVESVNVVRVENLKMRAGSEPVICVCGRIVLKNGLECCLCRTIFHKRCLCGERDLSSCFKHGLAPRFMCTNCIRTTRPNVDKLNEFRQQAQALKIKSKEVIVFLLMMHRVDRIQHAVERTLNIEGVQNALLTVRQNMDTYIKSGLNLPMELKEKVHSYQSNWANVVINENMLFTHNVLPPYKVVFRDVYLDRKLSCLIYSLLIEMDCVEVTLYGQDQIHLLCQAFHLDFNFQGKGTFQILSTSMNLTSPPNSSSPSQVPQTSNPLPPPSSTPPPPTTTQAPKRRLSQDLTNSKKSLRSPSKPTEPPRPTPCIRRTRRGVLTKKRLMGSQKPGKRSDRAFYFANPGSTRDDWLQYTSEQRCASKVCSRPPDPELLWVKCDGKNCGLWFHLKCVFLNAGDVKEDTTFFCLSCAENFSKAKSPSPTPNNP